MSRVTTRSKVTALLLFITLLLFLWISGFRFLDSDFWIQIFGFRLLGTDKYWQKEYLKFYWQRFLLKISP